MSVMYTMVVYDYLSITTLVCECDFNTNSKWDMNKWE